MDEFLRAHGYDATTVSELPSPKRLDVEIASPPVP
jgi:hypothetical protein